VQSSTHWGGNTARIRTAAGPSRREAEAVESSMGSWKAAGTAAQEAGAGAGASARGWQRGCGAFPVDGLKGGGAAG